MTDFTNDEKNLLKWAVAFIYECGIHNPQAAINAVNLTNLVGRLTQEQPKTPPKAEEKK